MHQVHQTPHNAKKWIFEDSEQFTNICLDAGFETEYVRQIAIEMIEYHHAKQHNTTNKFNKNSKKDR